MSGDLRYPEMRLEIIGCLEDLADLELQRRSWLGGETIQGRWWNAASPINELDSAFEDSENPSESIGYTLRNEFEAALVKEVLTAIGVALSQVRDVKKASDRELLATPAWPGVVEAAKRAVKGMSPE